jgi:predicted aspartyl protease
MARPALRNILLFIITWICSGEMLAAGHPNLTIPAKQGSDSSSAIISFSRAGNLILVRARVDTLEGNFILDTGAPGLVLNLTYFRDFPMAIVPDGVQGSMTGNSAPLMRTWVQEVVIGSVNYPRMEADVVNLGHIENSRGVQVMGLLGMELFSQCEMIIDYENNLIYLHRIGKGESSSYRHTMLEDINKYHTIPVDLADNRIIAKTQVAGRNLRLVVDCAAESNVLDSRLPNKIFEQVTITRKVKLVGANQAKVDALHGTLKNMKVGPLEMGDMQVLITNLEKTCFSYTNCVDGILGVDFLSRQKIGFNFVKRQMYIWK